MKARLPRTISVLLAELEEELLNTLKLLDQLKLENLDQEQLETMLVKLSTAISHLHTHTDGLDELIDDFLARGSDDQHHKGRC